MKQILGIFALAALSTAAGAQDRETSTTIKAYAAGYKAAFTCSATFNGGKTPEMIQAQELTGIYQGFRAPMAELPDAVTDHKNKRVSVKFNDDLPPRISQWREGLGCTQLPVGADFADAQYLPSVDITRPNTSDSQPWKKLDTGSSALKAKLKSMMTDPYYGKDALTTALLVATPEELLAEEYIEGYTPKTSQRTWSVAKSIAASVIGAAVEDGMIDVGEPANITEWQSPIDPRKNITLENLLHMASGIDSNRAGNRTDRLYAGGGRMSDSATEHSLDVKPGTRFKYANNDTLLAVRALKNSFDSTKAYNEYPFTALLNKLGMNDTVLEIDWEGNFVLSSQVWTTSRDMARLGILHLQDGVWNGERILPEGWVKYIATAKGPQPGPRRDGTPTMGYGAQWWLYDKNFDGIPNDAYAARGNRGQYLVVVPSRNLVLIRRGHDPAGGEGFKLDLFVRDVLKLVK